MLMQVKIINGQKTFVPISGTIAVNEVTVGNMQSVTSNAVADKINAIQTIDVYNGDACTCYKVGKVVTVCLYKNLSGDSPKDLETLPARFRPRQDIRFSFIANATDTPIGQAIIRTGGKFILYKSSGGTFASDNYVGTVSYITD